MSSAATTTVLRCHFDPPLWAGASFGSSRGCGDSSRDSARGSSLEPPAPLRLGFFFFPACDARCRRRTLADDRLFQQRQRLGAKLDWTQRYEAQPLASQAAAAASKYLCRFL